VQHGPDLEGVVALEERQGHEMRRLQEFRI
jgi:hypothetical protein